MNCPEGTRLKKNGKYPFNEVNAKVRIDRDHPSAMNVEIVVTLVITLTPGSPHKLWVK